MKILHSALYLEVTYHRNSPNRYVLGTFLLRQVGMKFLIIEAAQQHM
jgi:hypothetical protein